MQKVYQRINWENDPSKNTPLGEYNLNKIDYALDEIDNRVVNLGGYQEVASESANNAKVSETNAKQSEINAKHSELLAERYKNDAFSGTPEGYEQLVEDVRKMGLETTTATTLSNSKQGGYKLVSMSGKSEQKTTNGKNLINITDLLDNWGVTYTESGGVITCDGIGSGYSSPYQFSDTDITVSLSGIIKNLTSTNIYVELLDSTGALKVRLKEETAENKVENIVASKIRLDFQKTGTYTLQDVQLELGAVATEYEPFTNGASPNPNYPQSINNVGDCVEMMQGAYNSSTGAYASSTSACCSKHSVPCNVGDSIVLTVEQSANLYLMFYNNGTFVSTSNQASATKFTATVPSGVDSFNIRIDTPLETVGKITLTINGKYVLQFVENGEDEMLNATENNGYLDSSGSVVSSSGWYHKIFEVDRAYKYRLANGIGGVNAPRHCWFDSNMTLISAEVCYTRMLLTPPSNAKYLGVSYKTDTISQVQKETTAYVLLNEPLRDGDLLGRKQIDRKRISVTFDGSDDEAWGIVQGKTGYEDKSYYYITLGAYSSLVLSEGMCTHFTRATITISTNVIGFDILNSDIYNDARLTIRPWDMTDSTINTLEAWKEWLAENPITLEYELAEPIIEELDTESQKALNSLETFDTVTYINVDSRVQPSEIVGEYGTSEVGARLLTIEAHLENERLEELGKIADTDWQTLIEGSTSLSGSGGVSAVVSESDIVYRIKNGVLYIRGMFESFTAQPGNPMGRVASLNTITDRLPDIDTIVCVPAHISGGSVRIVQFSLAGDGNLSMQIQKWGSSDTASVLSVYNIPINLEIPLS